MHVAPNAAEVLAKHTTPELECVDRLYLNGLRDDAAKRRGHGALRGLIERIPFTNRHRVTDDGLRIALCYHRTSPGLAPGDARRLPRADSDRLGSTEPSTRSTGEYSDYGTGINSSRQCGGVPAARARSDSM